MIRAIIPAILLYLALPFSAINADNLPLGDDGPVDAATIHGTVEWMEGDRLMVNRGPGYQNDPLQVVDTTIVGLSGKPLKLKDIPLGAVVTVKRVGVGAAHIQMMSRGQPPAPLPVQSWPIGEMATPVNGRYVTAYFDMASGHTPIDPIVTHRFWSTTPQSLMYIPIRIMCNEGYAIKEGRIASLDPKLLREIAIYAHSFRGGKASDLDKGIRFEVQAKQGGPWIEVPYPADLEK